MGEAEKAEQAFANLPSKDNFSYAVMSLFLEYLLDESSPVNAFGLNGMGSEATQLFHRVPSELITEATCIVVLNACSHSGLINDARAIFERIPTKTQRIYGAMVGNP